MLQFHGVIAREDIEQVKRLGLFGTIFAAEPAPQLGRGGDFNPCMTRFYHTDGKITDVFSVSPTYYLHQNGQFRPISEVAPHGGNKYIDLASDWDQKMDLGYVRWLMLRCEELGGFVRLPFPDKWMTKLIPVMADVDIHFTTTTFNSGTGNPASAACDGYIRATTSATSYATLHALTTGTDLNSGGADTASRLYIQNTKSGTFFGIARSIVNFDTSALTSSATISAATLSTATTASLGGSHGDSDSMSIVANSIVSHTAYALADFGSFGTTKLATDIAIASLSGTSGTYNDFALNATGISNISLTSVSHFGLRTANDIAVTAPTGFNDELQSSSSLDAGKPPKLVVTYTLGASTNSGFFNLI